MKTKVLSLFAAIVFATLMLPFGAAAHHGTAAYDDQHPLTLDGVVTEFNWANPHVQIYYDAKDSKGNMAHWAVETLSPGKLARSGWNKDSLKAGDKITITVWAAKSGAPVGFMRKLIVNGKELSIDEKAN